MIDRILENKATLSKELGHSWQVLAKDYVYGSLKEEDFIRKTIGMLTRKQQSIFKLQNMLKHG